MARFPAVLQALVEPLNRHELFFVPESGAWSIAQILGHLADEEVEDFRARLRLTLESPDSDWVPIDPEASVRDRHYQQPSLAPDRAREPNESLARYIRERAASVAWLCSLHDPDWTVEHVHPKLGAFSAGSLLGSWCAHDLLHLRQIAKRVYEMTNLEAQPYSTRYAGQWAV